MLRKLLGGLSLFVFVLMFMAYPLIVVKIADASNNVIYDRSHTVYYVCPGGGINYSYTNDCVDGNEYNHPSPTYDPDLARVCRSICNGIRVYCPNQGNCGLIHTSHNTTYNNLTTSENVYVSSSHWSCR